MAIENQSSYEFTSWERAAALATEDPTYDGVAAVTAIRQNYNATRTLLGARPPVTATIYDNAITLQGAACVLVDTENGAPEDELITIESTYLHANILQLPLCPDGSMIYLQAANDARKITVKNGTGQKQIALYDGEDVELSTRWWLPLQLINGIWVEQQLRAPFDPTPLQEAINNLQLAVNDPFSIWPKRVPTIIWGCTFSGRNVIMPGETVARPDWFICDGGSDGKGGTVPDMQGAFPYGDGVGAAWGDKGGSATHNHGGSITVNGTTIGVSGTGSHTHGIGGDTGVARAVGAGVVVNEAFPKASNDIKSTNAGSAGSHSHSGSVTINNTTTYPPYVRVKWVIRV